MRNHAQVKKVYHPGQIGKNIFLKEAFNQRFLFLPLSPPIEKMRKLRS